MKALFESFRILNHKWLSQRICRVGLDLIVLLQLWGRFTGSLFWPSNSFLGRRFTDRWLFLAAAEYFFLLIHRHWTFLWHILFINLLFLLLVNSIGICNHLLRLLFKPKLLLGEAVHAAKLLLHIVLREDAVLDWERCVEYSCLPLSAFDRALPLCLSWLIGRHSRPWKDRGRRSPTFRGLGGGVSLGTRRFIIFLPDHFSFSSLLFTFSFT